MLDKLDEIKAGISGWTRLIEGLAQGILKRAGKRVAAAAAEDADMSADERDKLRAYANGLVKAAQTSPRMRVFGGQRGGMHRGFRVESGDGFIIPHIARLAKVLTPKQAGEILQSPEFAGWGLTGLGYKKTLAAELTYRQRHALLLAVRAKVPQVRCWVEW